MNSGTRSEFDVIIVGGTAGGTAAALAAASTGKSVCLIEETDWLGGQLTSQGVCTPDEQRHIETFGATSRYYAFRSAVRDYYRTTYRLSESAASRPDFNPGNCWVSRLSYEPKVGAAILNAMCREVGQSLTVHFCAKLVDAEMDPENANRISSILVAAQDEVGQPMQLRLRAPVFLDATDTGELLALCGQEGEDWVVGAESASQTGEPDAPDMPRKDWVQPFTFPFALEWSPETIDTNVITPPNDYEELKALQKYHIKHGAITGLFHGAAPWWSYRRVLAAENFVDSRIPHDTAMINTAGNDFYGGNILGENAGDAVQQAATLARARRASRGYVYWLQTECPREDSAAEETGGLNRPSGDAGGLGRASDPVVNLEASEPSSVGYPEFRLRTDIFDTPDGCAPMPYIRESRRICSVRPILEQEIVVRDFSGTEWRGERARASFMPDTVGIGHYALDIHPNGHGEPNHYVATRPFQIPLGALIPRRLENLLPACKNLGTTHLTNGAYRLHPIEWNIGETSGLLAAFCLQLGVLPRSVSETPGLLQMFQKRLLVEGIPLHWFIDVPIGHPAFIAVQLLAGRGLTLGSETDLLFYPDEPITDGDWTAWQDQAGKHISETFHGARAEAAIALL